MICNDSVLSLNGHVYSSERCVSNKECKGFCRSLFTKLPVFPQQNIGVMVFVQLLNYMQQLEMLILALSDFCGDTEVLLRSNFVEMSRFAGATTPPRPAHRKVFWWEQVSSTSAFSCPQVNMDPKCLKFIAEMNLTPGQSIALIDNDWSTSSIKMVRDVRNTVCWKRSYSWCLLYVAMNKIDIRCAISSSSRRTSLSASPSRPSATTEKKTWIPSSSG